jgi:hypothetical protein
LLNNESAGASRADGATIMTRAQVRLSLTRTLIFASLLLWASPAWAAFGSVGPLCSASIGTASALWNTIVPSNQLDAGNLGVVVVASDNSGTVNGDLDEIISVSDTVGNDWRKAREFSNTRGTAAGGATVSVWYTKASVNLPTTGRIAVKFYAAISAKAVTCWEFTTGAGSGIAVEWGGDRADTGDAGAITLSGLASAEHLWLRGTGVEDNVTTYTATTNPNIFTGFGNYLTSTTSGGGAAQQMAARGEFRISTATSETTDPTTSSADNASTMVALVEVVDSTAKVLSGSYKGNGTAGRCIPVGFVSDVVLVKGDTTEDGVMRTSTMSGDLSKDMFTNTALESNLIQSLSATCSGVAGFTVGSAARVNSSGVMYYWTAFRAGAGKMVVGSYTGSGSAGVPAGSGIDAIGFSPDLVFVMAASAPAAGYEAIHRSSASNATAGGFTFWDSAAITSTVTNGANGFTVGTATYANTSGIVYHWVAFNDVTGYMDIGKYMGDGNATEDITTVGFPAELLIVKRVDSGGRVIHRSPSLKRRDQDGFMHFNGAGSFFGWINKLLSNGFQVGQQYNVNEFGAQYFYYAWKRTPEPLVLSGAYGGTGVDQSIVDLGFRPDVIIIKRDSGAIGVIKTSTMSSNDAKPLIGNAAVTSNLVRIDSGGFTVLGSNAMVNDGTGCPSTCPQYYFIAFKADPSTMSVGKYTGNGTSKIISSANSSPDFSFAPVLVFIMAATGVTDNEAVHASPSGAFNFSNSVVDTTWVTSLNTDGFTVGSNARVNTNTTDYHYVAWQEIPGMMDVGTYVGNGSDNQNFPADFNVPGTWFEPEYVIVKHSNGSYTAHHPGSVGRSTDLSLHFVTLAGADAEPNEIQTLQADGFQVGTSTRVNNNTTTMIYYAWKRPSTSAFLTAVRLTAFTATRYDRGVLAEWRTGYEVDNLGFNVYRDVGGARTKVTRSMIAGSGLMAGQGTAVHAEQRYAAWDLDGASTDPSAVYWLEDLDFNGTSTWHGPITPVEGGLQAPEVPTSSALGDLGKRARRRGTVWVDHGATVERPRKSDRPAARATGDPGLATQRRLAAQAGVKIGVDRPGWYRVTQPELIAAGLDPQAAPQMLRLFAEGVEQAIAVTGAQGGRFDAGGAIEFYGTGLDTPYTATRTYWLIAGDRAGRRMAVHAAPAGRAPSSSASSFPFTLQQKERSIYFASLRNGDEENWFGAFIYEEPTDLTLEVANDAGGAAELEIALQGVTAVADVTPDHRVGVRVNGTEVGEVVFDGQAVGVQTFAVPAGTLVEGANAVTLVARGGEADYSLVDLVRLRYPHRYRADADLLRFTGEGPGPIKIGGFARPAIRVIDVTDPLSPTELRGTVAADGGLSAVSVNLAGSGPRTLLAFTDATVATAASVRPNAPSHWATASNAADYLAVSHGAFAGRVEPLLARRRAQGLSTALVDIEDVYDEFSFGEKTPYALKEFVTYARTAWKGAPRFLVLVGDATMDPRDYAGFGEADFVPTKQMALAHVALETASDDWFADADDDGLPELAVGRLSVRSAAQADAMVAKILAYEESDGHGWSRNVLLVADQNEGNGNFEAATKTLARVVPADYTVHQVLSGAVGAERARLQIHQAVDEGQLIVNYIGHGSVRIWSNEALLTTEDVAQTWRNVSRLPFVVAMNCLNGLFHGIYDEESLAETLLRTEGGGAVAAWASSGVTDSTIQAPVNQELFRLLFSDPTLTVGQAVVAAKRVVSDPDVRRSWIFFGDPALRLNGLASAVEHRLAEERSLTAAVLVAADIASAAEEGALDQDAADETPPAAALPPARLVDWNGDRRADVFLYATDQWRAVLSSTEARVRAGVWDTAWDAYPADLNGDGSADLVLVDRRTGAWAQAINDGALQFRYTYGAWGSGWAVRIADLNGDGRDDVLLTDPASGAWTSALSDGTGHFTFRTGHAMPASEVTIGDFNGDGRADAFLSDRKTGDWTVALSDGRGDFTYIAGHAEAGGAPQAANLNGDTRTDLLFYNPVTGHWSECETAKPGQFTCRSGVWAPGLHVVLLAGKERDDVLLYAPETGAWSLVMDQPGAAPKAVAGTWPPSLTIATGDVNADGLPDLLLYDRTSGAWSFGLARGSGRFDYRSGQWSAGWSIAGRP